MQDIIRILDTRRADNRFQDGALPHAQGVQSFQVLRANRAHPEEADGIGWTYNHAPMLTWAYGKFFCEYLSNPVDEHEVPGHTLLTASADGHHWTKPQVIFPEVEVPTAPYKGPRSALLRDTAWTVAHQRMGFYHASNDVLLALAFYGIVHDRNVSAPCDGWGVGRAVRRINPDGTPGKQIYFLIYNEPAGYTRENTDVFPPYTACEDKKFVAACDELLDNGPVIRQMYEEQRFDKNLFPTPGAEALSYYTVNDGEMIGMYKKSLVSVSHDGGKTWTEPAFQPTIHTATGKVWGQRTADGRFALLYNPTTDGQHRWPIAAVTGEDGHSFDHMCTVTGDMSPQRYGGIDKNLGPQYLRGIAECNQQAPDGNIWLTYSNNKEDIWVSRIPVPITDKGSAEGALRIENALPADLNVYAPVWAPVEAADGKLALSDTDPYDQAVIEKAVAPFESGSFTLTFSVQAGQDTGAVIEWQDDTGRVPLRLVFRQDCKVYLLGDGRTDPWCPYVPGEPMTLTVTFDGFNRKCAVELNGVKKTVGFSASVNSINRLVIKTKEHIPALSTLDSCGKYGTKAQVLPGSEERAALNSVSVSGIDWKVTQLD